jgi:hypothetical protein
LAPPRPQVSTSTPAQASPDPDGPTRHDDAAAASSSCRFPSTVQVLQGLPVTPCNVRPRCTVVESIRSAGTISTAALALSVAFPVDIHRIFFAGNIVLTLLEF